MEGQRFDSFSKALARWISRRRLIGGLVGGAAGLAAKPGAGASDRPDPAVLKEIARRSAEILPKLPPPENLARQEFDPVRLPLFAERIRDLASAGAGAEWWTHDQLACFLRVIEIIPLSVSAGADGYLETWADARLKRLVEEGANEITTPDRGESGDRPTFCTATCLEVWTSKVSGCGGDPACLVNAFWDFIECFLLFGNDESVCLASLVPSGCTAMVYCACAGNCR